MCLCYEYVHANIYVFACNEIFFKIIHLFTINYRLLEPFELALLSKLGITTLVVLNLMVVISIITNPYAWGYYRDEDENSWKEEDVM